MAEKDCKLMKPRVDFCFKEIMKDDYVRLGFTSAILKLRPEEIEYTILMPTILEKKYEDDKIGILDVRVKLKNGTQMDIEMQVTPYALWPERSVFYIVV